MTDAARSAASGGRAGWAGSLAAFRATRLEDVVQALRTFLPDADESQVRAWKASVPALQRVAGARAAARVSSDAESSILEYVLMLDERRADAVLLLAGPVVVVEAKGKVQPSQCDVDQVAAYARDLTAYHRRCDGRAVEAVLMPTGMVGPPRRTQDGVWVAGPDAIVELLQGICAPPERAPLALDEFLDIDAYQPLPTLVQAARSLFENRSLKSVWRADARTRPTVDYILDTCERAAREHSRHLILVTGAPGSGKTLVGLRAAYAERLDRIAVERKGRKPTAPAVFLSGNQPLVTLLQFILKSSAFVRPMKAYLKNFVVDERTPPHHVLVFDEAQRAFSAAMVAEKQQWDPSMAASEPELLLRLSARVPEWSVVVGLIGTGQEINRGEEEGIAPWRHAVERRPDAAAWTVHVPPLLQEPFVGGAYRQRIETSLALNFSLRFHLVDQLHRLVGRIVDPEPKVASGAGAVAAESPSVLPHADARRTIRLTRRLDEARAYLQERYRHDQEARYGLLVSSRDKSLGQFGIVADFASLKRLQIGRWFMGPMEAPDSGCHLRTPLTEFQIQGLELDMALVAWGTDFRRMGGAWSDDLGQRYQRRADRVSPRDKLQLRANAYRVLLTRGRDGTIVFVPPLRELDETWTYLRSFGLVELEESPTYEA